MTSAGLPSDQDASGRDLGDAELELLHDVILSGTLTSTKGQHTPLFERELAEMLGVDHVVACASGSAAVHVAIAAIDPEPGDEVITTSITDMGALTPILYQGAIPVFADVDPQTGNLDPSSVADRVSDRTRAIVVTHLFGRPCDMTALTELAASRDIPIIEDCAQAYLASHRGTPVGRFGAVGAFSAQQGKHITAGEGGAVVTDDAALARRMRVFVNKAWPYGEADPDHEFIALNYRTTELQSAVLRAQLRKLPAAVATRIAMADRLTKQLDGLEGIDTPSALRGDVHSYWRYPLLVDGNQVNGGPSALASELRAMEIPSAPRYIQKPAFRCRVFAQQRTFGESRWPFTLARPAAVDYSRELFPGTFDYLDRVLVLPWNERINESHVDRLSAAIGDATERLRA